MPLSENDEEVFTEGGHPFQTPPGQTLAVAAEALYIANLLVLPGLSFIILLKLYFKHRTSAPLLAICHLKQTVAASIWAGILLVAANLAILLLGGYTSANTWTVLIIYFTTCHSTLVLLGILGLAKAMAGQKYIFPLLGRPCE
ncbi:MAG: hypothetical protein Q8K43_08640 [Sulfurimicrobium sp.]|jgi:hypothetical protein|nr:hypothetical protein [Sulfurimicrobium sp.]MDP1897939.1 hypothetical protein [Sulfurimicrobium sp.]MDP2200290.1 hypothetical protein [Sulfurimicrobium sp.]MDP2961604.1 hypothetical protein [Sulfurimicrobium sp.]MDP3687963.1 hypothetical protein [Sulfurimicrobium sp.]